MSVYCLGWIIVVFLINIVVMKITLTKQEGYKTLSSAAISVFVIGVVLEHPEVAQLRGKFLKMKRNKCKEVVILYLGFFMKSNLKKKSSKKYLNYAYLLKKKKI